MLNTKGRDGRPYGRSSRPTPEDPRRQFAPDSTRSGRRATAASGEKPTDEATADDDGQRSASALGEAPAGLPPTGVAPT
eukprot:3519686-Heterocapsa_arctica.AAC.1